MYFLLSPAKNLDEKTPLPHSLEQHFSSPELIEHSITLMKTLKKLDAIEIQELMGVSDKIAELNVMRNLAWCYPFADNKKPAIYLFNGDVYHGLDAYSLDEAAILYLNQHMGILSGLYGLLRPLDEMLPYRLEMGVKFKTPQADTLYEFWGDTITKLVNQRLADMGSQYLINLASNEYFSAIQKTKLDAPIITPKFLDFKNGQYKIISMYAKKARGMMAKFAALHRLSHPEELKAFDMEGYYFDEADSDDTTFVFKRGER